MSAGAGETSTQTCSRCGASFPGWSLFCTSCGMQGADSVARPRTTQAPPVYDGRPQHRTTSSSHAIWSIVWTVLAFALCPLTFFPAFSQAKKARMRGEPAADAATTVSWVGLLIWAMLFLVGVALAMTGTYEPGTQPPR